MPMTDHEQLRRAIDLLPSVKILVIGDLIIDHFIWGTVSRISPEAPVPVVNVTNESMLLGGSANVLHNIFKLGAKAAICGVIGTDPMGDRLLELISELPSPTNGIARTKDRPTTKKTRIIAQHQQVVRFDREKSGEIDQICIEAIKKFIGSQLANYDAVIVSDYAKGVINIELMDYLRSELANNPDIPLVIDPKPTQPERFKGAAIITPNHLEAEQMSGIKITDGKSLKAAGEKLLTELDSKAILITRGESGMSIFERDKPMITIPTVAREVFDVTGAGATVIAALALGLAAKLSFAQAAALANYAAGIVVGKLGTATVSSEEILEVLK